MTETTFTRFFHFIYRACYLNLFWCFFVMLGLGVFGLLPATYALNETIKVSRSFELKEDFDQMYHTFRSTFWSMNKLAVIYYGLGLLLMSNLMIALTLCTSHHFFLLIIFLLLLASFFLEATFFLALNNYRPQTNQTTWLFLKKTWSYGFIAIKDTLIMGISTGFLSYLLLTRYPALLFLGGFVCLLLVGQKISWKTQVHVQQKIQQFGVKRNGPADYTATEHINHK